MAKVKLQKIRVTGLKKHYKLLMQELHRSGILEITENQDFIKHSSDSTDNFFQVFDLARIDFAIRFLTPMDSKKSMLDTMLSGGKIILSEQEAKERLKHFSPLSEKVISECEEIEEGLGRSERELAKIREKRRFLLPFRSLRTRLQSNLSTDRSVTMLGAIARKQEKLFIQSLAQESHLIDVQVFGRSNDRAYLRVTAFVSLAEKCLSILRECDVEILDFSEDFGPWFGHKPREIIRIFDQKESELMAYIQELKKRQKDLASHLDDLRILYDYNAWRKKKHDLQHKILKTDTVFAFEGWLPVAQFEYLGQWITKSFAREVVLEKTLPHKDEVEPVLTANKTLFSPFEAVTEMFGLPSKKDLDPTPYLAPFFVAFFGLCLSDVGYGGLLTLLATILLVGGKFSKAARDGIRLLLFCGISAILGGVILGGYFGMTPEMIPGFLSFLLNPDHVAGMEATMPFRGQIFDPMSGSGPILFLQIALALGTLQLLFGLLLDFVSKLKNKEYVSAFCDPFTWFFFLVMVIGFALADTLGLDKELFKNLSLAGAILLVITQGRHQKNWLLKPIFGVLGLYNITGYLSDLLSYSRIMALGLATGVIGFAMNLTANVLYDMMPHWTLGLLIAVLVLVGGHMLNFFLSLLGAFVHSGRLQFIEFFSKFFDGNGRKFQPFVRQKKYLFFR